MKLRLLQSSLWQKLTTHEWMWWQSNFALCFHSSPVTQNFPKEKREQRKLSWFRCTQIKNSFPFFFFFASNGKCYFLPLNFILLLLWVKLVIIVFLQVLMMRWINYNIGRWSVWGLEQAELQVPLTIEN